MEGQQAQVDSSTSMVGIWVSSREACYPFKTSVDNNNNKTQLLLPFQEKNRKICCV